MADSLPAKQAKDHREALFIRNLCQGLSVKKAALSAGYSESYAESQIYQRVKKPDFQAKVREAFLAGNTLEVPKVLSLYSRALDKIAEKGNEDELLGNLAKAKHIPKQILQIAQILSPDSQPMHQTVNIKELSVFMRDRDQAPNCTKQVDAGDVIDGEVVSA